MNKISLTFCRIKRNLTFLGRFYSVASEKKRICIVGSGPAGFYTAHKLLRKNKFVEVDIFEKLPVPFGLFRYGVAPDHPEVKNVTNKFTKIALHEQCNFYGNINVGEDVTVSELLDSYHAVVLAHGASSDKALGIPGENSKNVFPARTIVGWFNGHPDYVNEQIDLNSEVVTIVGNGNVALDVARILLRNLDELKGTDISSYAYESLKKSKIRKVVLLGRRGPAQAAFTTPELRDIIKLKGCHVLINDSIIKQSLANEENLRKEQARKVKVMSEVCDQLSSSSNVSTEMLKCLELKFFRSPKIIVPDVNDSVEKLVCAITKINNTLDTKNEFEVTDEEDVIDCGMVIRSVGYQSTPIDSFVPFDSKRHIIPNVRGRVIDRKGLYCSGWAKSGPIGVLVSTMYESYETGEVLLEDIAKGEIMQELPHDREYIFKLLKSKGVRVITFKDWEKIDSFELEKGKEMGKLREKVYRLEEMLKIVESS